MPSWPWWSWEATCSWSATAGTRSDGGSATEDRGAELTATLCFLVPVASQIWQESVKVMKESFLSSLCRHWRVGVSEIILAHQPRRIMQEILSPLINKFSPSETKWEISPAKPEALLEQKESISPPECQTKWDFGQIIHSLFSRLWGKAAGRLQWFVVVNLT